MNQIDITGEEIVPVYTNQFCSLFGNMTRQPMITRHIKKTNTMKERSQVDQTGEHAIQGQRLFRKQKYVKLLIVIVSLHPALLQKKKKRKEKGERKNIVAIK